MTTRQKHLPLEFHPLTPRRWVDFEQLFGERGACGGCWCMWWLPDALVYHSLAENYRKAGFREVARRSETRSIMRYTIRKRLPTRNQPSWGQTA